jgi:RNA polymerase sigma factor (TIGR02999 family)
MSGRSTEVSNLVLGAQKGDREALSALMPLVYDELRKMAAGRLRREREQHTLQPTALVHEAYLRLVDQSALNWQSRSHFLGIAAHMMRQVLVDHARRRRARKRAGAEVRVTLDDAMHGARGLDMDVLALDEALEALKADDPQAARVVELRYFGGLSIAETAEVLGVGTATVEREWRVARAWLRRVLGESG